MRFKRGRWNIRDTRRTITSSSQGWGVARILLALNRLQILDKVLQANVAQVLIKLDLVENRSPHRHPLRAVSGEEFVSTEHNGISHVDRGERTAIVLRKPSNVGNVSLEGLGHRPIPVTVCSVAGGTIVSEDARTIDWAGGFLGCSVLRGNGNEGEKKQKQ